MMNLWSKNDVNQTKKYSLESIKFIITETLLHIRDLKPAEVYFIWKFILDSKPEVIFLFV